MTVLEAAREIGLSSDCVYDLCKKGLLGHRRIGPNRGRIAITAEHIAAYLASCEVNETNAPGAVVSRPTVKRRVRSGRLDGMPNRHLRDVRPDGKPYRFMK